MIIDCRREWKEKYGKLRPYVNGKAIRLAWYLDTDEGLVKTYDLGDNKARASRGFNRSDYPAEWEIDAPEGGPVSRTIRGRVELKPL